MKDALNQIHWRSLKIRSFEDGKGLPSKDGKNLHRKSYLEIAKEALVKPNNAKRMVSGYKNTGSWQQVLGARKTSTQKRFGEGCTIFISKIPEQTLAKDIWDLFKSNGEVVDVILSRKKDKFNNRFGFVKTTNEEEAGKLISNVKKCKGLGMKMKMSINSPKVSADPRFGVEKAKENIIFTSREVKDKIGEVLIILRA